MRSGLSRRTFLSQSTAAAAGLWVASGPLARRLVAAPSQPGAELIAHTRNPLNAEPALDVLTDSFITPAKYFFVRDHAAIPLLDADTHTVEIAGLVNKPGHYTRGQLQDRFDPIDCPATVTCTGNRRSEHNWFRKPEGTAWNAGAIGTANWQGARLSDVLAAAGIKEGAAHVWFESLDEIPQDDGTVIPFGCSIPIEKVLADTAGAPGTMIAWGMNGEPLPPAHGFPLRIVVPGYVGGRSVKWLKKIVVSDRPSPNHYWTHSYRLYTESTLLALAESAPIYRFPINVAICEVLENNTADKGRMTVRGYALPSGRAEARIKRVEVSTGGTGEWVAAKLIDKPRPFCWMRWEATVSIPKDTKQLVARAVDTTGQVTPRRPDWNLKGYLYNGWHSLPIGGNAGQTGKSNKEGR